MKTNKAIIILMAVLFMVSSCEKLKHVKFTADYTGNVTIPPQNMDTVFTQSINSNIATIAKDNNTSPELIKSCKADLLRVKITSPEGQTFTFVRDVRVFIATENMPEIEIASRYNIPENATEFTCNVYDIELRPYLVADKFILKIAATNRQPVNVPVGIEVQSRFKFEANLLEALK